MNKSNINQLISKLNIPDLMYTQNGIVVDSIKDWEIRREEIKNIILKCAYGDLVYYPINVDFIEMDKQDTCGGKATFEKIKLKFTFEQVELGFDVNLIMPKITKIPVIVHPSFNRKLPHQLPIEEIVDRNIGIAIFNYQDVAEDHKNTFNNKFSKALIGDNRKPQDGGTLRVWAWACSKILDYLETRSDIDKENYMVLGHSRLGKTALLAGALDERFKFVFANNSGCAGDALLRFTRPEAEHIKDMTEAFPYWLNEIYNSYAHNEASMTFDQHFLVSLIAPRYICAGTAKEDIWADPNAQYLSYVIASKVWNLYGRKGLIHPNQMIQENDLFTEGTVGVYQRPLGHYLSRHDWNTYIDFFYKKIKEEKTND